MPILFASTFPTDLTLPLCVLFAYVLGCFNARYYLVRWTSARDLRQFGSGNAGATNAGRLLGPSGFALTLFGDMAKGALAIYIARSAGASTTAQLFVMFAVVAGHNWPAQLRFRGGKGVSTSCGALLFFDPRLTGLLLATCAVVLACTRRQTVAAMSAYALAPVAAAALGYDATIVALCIVFAGVVIFPHRQDLSEELFIRQKTSADPVIDPTPGSQKLQFKLATEESEFEAIHRLNYRTFVEEIPQHPIHSSRRLVDRFHRENNYVIALESGRLVGMIAMRGNRPFSLDAKVPDLDRYLPPERRIVEARLLAVEPAFRQTSVFVALLRHAARHCLDAGFDLAVISATTRQLKLYQHLGFAPFGPLVGTPAASYQPMSLTLEAFALTAEKSAALRGVVSKGALALPRPLNFLPGPVQTTSAVDSAFASPAVSHRCPIFLAQLQDVRRRLCQLTSARYVQVIPGSGSLANSIVAAQLGLGDTRGLVISNGEFGERLALEARRARLSFDQLRLSWSEPIPISQAEKIAEQLPPGGWIWFVHHETSTGRLNPLTELKALARRRNLRLCVDCISSIGSQPVDLRDVHLASGTSGKGLGAYPGLALVFHNYDPSLEPERLPSYLDLGHWATHASVPHTHSSNLVSALSAALHELTPARFDGIRENSRWLRSALRARGYAVVLPAKLACPGIVTIPLPATTTAREVGEELERRGFSLSFRSRHLESRNWIQISLFGNPHRHDLQRLLHAWNEVVGRQSRVARRASAPNLRPLTVPQLTTA